MSFNIPSPSIGQIFQTHHPFYVPKYQRGYAWEQEEVSDFINDVREILTSDPSAGPHFIGGIVHVHVPASNIVSRELEIVDGQQRMATVSLAMAAILAGFDQLASVARNRDIKGQCRAISEEIQEAFISYKETRGASRVSVPKLELSKTDEPFFRAIIERKSKKPTRSSHKLLLSAYNSIHKELVVPILDSRRSAQTRFDSLSKLYKTISERLVVIHIVSERRREAYRLFSVLNDRGRSLTEGDLLRARTLELLECDADVQAEVEFRWDGILDGSPTDVTKFLKAYFPSVTGRRAPTKDLFDAYQREFLPDDSDSDTVRKVQHFVSSLAEEKPRFDAIRDGLWPFPDTSIATVWDRDRLSRLVNVLRHEAAHPVLLSATKLGEKKFIQAVCLLERFVFRYITIVGAHPSPLYAPYNSEAKSMRTRPASYTIQALKRALATLSEERAPDEAFAANLVAKLEYSDNTQRNRDIRHLLSTLESYRRWYERGAKRTPVADKMTIFDVNATTLEHIYPSTATASQQSVAMEKAKNRLANLAIMADSDNSVIGNADFATKKKEFKNSTVGLTRRLAKFGKWTPRETKIREREIVEMAIAVFKI